MRRTRVPWLMSLLVLASATAPAGVSAQDTVGEAFCALFTVQEVQEVLGGDVEATPVSTGCFWTATTPDLQMMLAADWSSMSIAEQKAAWPDGSDVTIAGHTAYLSPGMFLDELLVGLDAGVLHLTITGFDGDVEAALTQLGELGVPRAGSLPPPAQPGPVPSMPAMDADPALEALFPATIGGEPVEVLSVAGEDAIFDPEDRAAVGEALGTMGKSFDDLTGAFAFSTAGALAAYRVAGGDAATFLPLIVGVMAEPGTALTPATVGGKDVSRIEEEPPSYAYPAGEVLWLVQADEPVLTEVLTALP